MMRLLCLRTPAVALVFWVPFLLGGCGGQADSGNRNKSGSDPDGTGGTGDLGDEVFPGCSSPGPLLPDAETGYFLCAEGTLWREESLECPNNIDHEAIIDWPQYVLDGLGGASGSYEIVKDECQSHSDCGEKSLCVARSLAQGECVPFGEDQWERACVEGCTLDSDCPDGAACICGPIIGRCESVHPDHGCFSDSDCGDNLHCMRDPFYGFACQLPTDECQSRHDCEEAQACSLYLSEHRACGNWADGC